MMRGLTARLRNLAGVVLAVGVFGCGGVPHGEMQEACREAVQAGSVFGIVDLLDDDVAGLQNFIGAFEDTPWASASAAHELGRWESLSERSDTSLIGDRVVRRHEQQAYMRVAVDGVPGGLTGTVRCYFIHDPEAREFWFWNQYGEGDGGWADKGDPLANVSLDYDPYLLTPQGAQQ